MTVNALGQRTAQFRRTLTQTAGTQRVSIAIQLCVAPVFVRPTVLSFCKAVAESPKIVHNQNMLLLTSVRILAQKAAQQLPPCF